MATISTTGDELIRVAAHGDAALSVLIDDPAFGRIATVRLDHQQAAQLASALDDLLVDAAGQIPAAPDSLPD